MIATLNESPNLPLAYDAAVRAGNATAVRELLPRLEAVLDQQTSSASILAGTSVAMGGALQGQLDALGVNLTPGLLNRSIDQLQTSGLTPELRAQLNASGLNDSQINDLVNQTVSNRSTIVNTSLSQSFTALRDSFSSLANASINATDAALENGIFTLRDSKTHWTTKENRTLQGHIKELANATNHSDPFAAYALARGIKGEVRGLLLKTGGHFAFADIYRAAARASSASLQAINGDPAALDVLRTLTSQIQSLIPKLPPQGPEEVLPPVISTLTIDAGHGGLIGVPTAPCRRPECADYTGFAKEARRHGYNVTALNETITFEKPNNTDVFLLPPPITPYSPDEIDAITHYVQAGGGPSHPSRPEPTPAPGRVPSPRYHLRGRVGSSPREETMHSG